MWTLAQIMPYLLVIVIAFVPVLSFRSYMYENATTPWPSLNRNYQQQQFRNDYNFTNAAPTWVRAKPLTRTNAIFNNNTTRLHGFSTGELIYDRNEDQHERQTNPVQNQDTSDNELRDFSESLLSRDINNAAKYVKVNYQGKTTSRSKNDEAPLPLLSINSQAYTIVTIQKLLPLYDNYILEANVNEDYTAQEKNEEDILLESIITTPIMQQTKNFLKEKGKISTPDDFKSLLKEIWFNQYSRGKGKIGSSGFEHVFLAEIKNSQVSGLHNWIYFHEEEAKNRANYLGYMKKIDVADKGSIIKFHFTFEGIDKPVASMFVGFSPELEMALYTVCFVLRADHICPLQLDNKRFIIRTYSYRFRGKSMIGSAFPEI